MAGVKMQKDFFAKSASLISAQISKKKFHSEPQF